MTMRLRSPVIVLLIAGLSGALSMRAADTAGPATFFVASAGNDNWSGRLALPNGQRTDGPFATLQAACRAARGVGTEPRRTIVVQAGEYFLNDPVSLTNRDSGLQIVAAPGAAACLYGARRVQGWQKDGEKFYAADLPGVKEGTWDFRTLIVNGRHCPRARLPKQGYFEHLRIERCHAHHIGACGIRFHGSGIEIADNHVHDVGLTYPSAIALTGDGDNCRISHNHVHHTPYSAVTCGGKDNRIEANRIHHAMQELHDGAGIYCFGGKGIVLCDNFIYDILDTGGSNRHADPKLTAYRQGKVEFAPDSPVRELGIEPIDVSTAGPRP